MLNASMTNQMFSVFLGFGLCISTTSLMSAEVNSAATPPSAQEDDCSQEILLAYFPGVFVKETLKRYNVPQDKWDPIIKVLAERDKQIIKIVEAKASKMDPNPLKDPQQRQAAVKIFRETLTENFSSVMKANGVNDEKQIQAMLDDIQQQKAKRFASCMQQQHGAAKHVEHPSPKPAAP